MADERQWSDTGSESGRELADGLCVPGGSREFASRSADQNEDDIAKAVTEYSGDIHHFVPGVPAVSDPVAACAVTVACLAAGAWRHFFGG